MYGSTVKTSESTCKILGHFHLILMLTQTWKFEYIRTVLEIFQILVLCFGIYLPFLRLS